VFCVEMAVPVEFSKDGHPSCSAAPYVPGTVRAADPSRELLNFGPGPAPMPAEVLHSVQAELLDYEGTGLSVLSMSHRAPEFSAILADSEAVLRRVLQLPPEFELLFMHGGGHGQFAAVPLNLCVSSECSADYIITGSWSKRAATEAAKYAKVNVVVEGTGDCLPPLSDWKLEATSRYVYICSNETVNGLEFHSLPECPPGVPLVVDMSSDICSKRIDWSRVGVAFACTPKNIGHSGLTIVAIRRDLLEQRRAQDICPGILNWQVILESENVWNTPPTFNIYTTGKVCHWIEQQGGIEEMERRAVRKSELLYNLIDQSGGFYSTPCMVKGDRSRMNVPFMVKGGDSETTDRFLREAYSSNIVGLLTKTPFGYGKCLRASLYNHLSVAHTETLVAFMATFAEVERH